MILSCFSDKGGVGKTTIAQNVASALDLPMFDFDPQRDAARWQGTGDTKVSCTEMSEGDIRRFLNRHANGKSLVVCDLPPGTPGLPIAALSDLCIVPTRPGEADLVALGKTLRRLGQAKAAGNPDLRIGVVLTQARVASIRTLTVDQGLRKMASDEGFSYLGTLHHRVAIEMAGVRGCGILQSGDGAAAHEFRMILNGIQEILNS